MRVDVNEGAGPVRPRRGPRKRRGATLVWCAMVLVVLLGMCALVVDLGVAYHATAQLQYVADVAALAGADKWREVLDDEAAKAEVLRVASANTVLRDAQIVHPATDIVLGCWDAPSGTVVPWDETRGNFAIQVTVRRTTGSANGPIPTFFARIWRKNSLEATRTAIAGLQVTRQSRRPVGLMIVQDGSGSFQQAWATAIDADVDLLKLINGVCVQGDAAGMVTFNAQLPESWLRNNRPSYSDPTYYDLYRPYPTMNNGIKYTTDVLGRPVKTDKQGNPSSSGQVRPMAGELVAFNPGQQGNLPQALNDMGALVKKGNPWGDTDTAVGLNYAIDRLLATPIAGAQQVIVLVSDGKPHDVRGGYYTTQKEGAARAAADRAAAAGIRIHTVTLEGSNGADYAFNEGLARHGGVALRAADAHALRDLLTGIGSIEVGHPRLYR